MTERWLTRAGASPQRRRLAALRVFVAGFATVYFAVRCVHFSDYGGFSRGAFHPVGVARLLGEPLAAWAPWCITALTVLVAALATLGVAYRVAAPALFVLALWGASYRSSWGMLFHTENLLVLHLGVLALAPAADAYAVGPGGARRRRGPRPPYGLWTGALSLITTITYLLAGIAKLKASGLGWGSGSVLATHVAYDAVRKIEFGRWSSPLGALMVAHSWAFVPLAWATLGLELFAPLALASRRLGRAFAAAAWAFHVGVLASMLIVFAYPLSGVAYLSFFRPERLLDWGLGRLRRARSPRASRADS